MKLFKKISTLGLVGMFFVSVLAVPVTLAQNSGQENGGSGLQLSPTRTIITAQPGEKKTFSISLKNVTQGEVTAQVFLNDFESDNQSGSPQIIVDPKKEATPYSLKEMLKDLKNVTLKAGETKQVEQTIDVPSNVAPGAYFGALRYAAVPVGQQADPNQQRQVSLTASVAHLVFVEIPGEVVQKIQIQKTAVLNEKAEKRSIIQAPKKVAVTVKNLGNGFSRPFGKVTVKYGSKEVDNFDINNTDDKAMVLPQSSRVFTNDIKNVSKPGKYTVSAGMAYGNGGEVINSEMTFWYLPLWFVALIAVLLIALVLGGFMGYKKMANKSLKKSKR